MPRTLTPTDAIEALTEARERTLTLVAGVGDEDLERVHSTLMSPLVWDLGHIAAFEEEFARFLGGGHVSAVSTEYGRMGLYFILKALDKHGNSRARAAEALGISRVTLYKKMKKYGLMPATPRGNRVAAE